MSIIVPLSYSSVKYFLEEIKPLFKDFNFKYRNLDIFEKLNAKQKLNSNLLLISHELLFPEEFNLRKDIYYNHYFLIP